MKIEFLLNGEAVTVDGNSPTRTLLDYLREECGLTGTKEGCNEGDCGACSIMITDDDGTKALNACILFLPQLHGKSVRTVEGLAAPDGTLHPVQSEMIENHGSQCGFCTPGFIMSMAAAHQNSETNHDDVLAGNLCRCTGYVPIIRAARAAEKFAKPKHLQINKLPVTKTIQSERVFVPKTSDELADWYIKNPDATLIGGATDVGLWINKDLCDLSSIAFIGQIDELRGIEISDSGMAIGASVTLSQLHKAVAKKYASLGELVRRYGSTQVRNAATIGGNIANGSPIGDGPPALIALGAQLYLRRGDDFRNMALEDYFIDYGKQDRKIGEFIIGIAIPEQPNNLKCYKITKRFDQDISTLCGCFNITRHSGKITSARIAFGGMAETPKRATSVEIALIGKPWTQDTITAAVTKFSTDYQPISDVRASAAYRAQTAQNLLQRYFDETFGHATNVLEVTP
ncbi:MAG TPA: xanthine dehydrogenase small subunit [Rhodobacteraceae bacterium]|nr:xanthine dehydrogenase small subunit [Paracoccaceae bacterium]|tara:strand:- start:9829 stop:11202 length:1374 start_codon:yes stop_codon:yes gene_type:complete